VTQNSISQSPDLYFGHGYVLLGVPGVPGITVSGVLGVPGITMSGERLTPGITVSGVPGEPGITVSGVPGEPESKHILGLTGGCTICTGELLVCWSYCWIAAATRVTSR